MFVASSLLFVAGTKIIFGWKFGAFLTDFIPPSFLPQVFQPAFVIDSSFKLA